MHKIMTKIKTNKSNSSQNKNKNSSIFKEELLDEILKDYNHQNPEELIGSNSLLKQLKQAIIQRALESEMTQHLGYKKHSKSDVDNYRNGHSKKRVITDDGEIEINPTRDRDGSFEPKNIEKRQNRFTGFDDNIISMYSRGMSVGEIQGHLKDVYGNEVSKDFISNVTDYIIPIPIFNTIYN